MMTANNVVRVTVGEIKIIIKYYESEKTGRNKFCVHHANFNRYLRYFDIHELRRERSITSGHDDKSYYYSLLNETVS